MSDCESDVPCIQRHGDYHSSLHFPSPIRHWHRGKCTQFVSSFGEENETQQGEFVPLLHGPGRHPLLPLHALPIPGLSPPHLNQHSLLSTVQEAPTLHFDSHQLLFSCFYLVSLCIDGPIQESPVFQNIVFLKLVMLFREYPI